MIKDLIHSLRVALSGKPVRFATPSLSLCHDRTVLSVLGETPVFCRPFLPMNCQTFVGWGRRSGAMAAAMARRRGASALLLEDGFLRSFHRDDCSSSVVFDDVGIYYDAFAPSALERLIAEPIDAGQEARIAAVLQRWRDLRLSKYNAGAEYDGDLPDSYVLVVDQVRHDASVRCGMADERSFEAMLNAAIRENPDCTVIVKMHPDIHTRSKSGHFDVARLQAMTHVMVIAEGCLPSRLIENARKVYVVTSQIGFEALIWQKPVRCFGMPFYAGWGLTEDALSGPARRRPVGLLQLAMAALIRYPRYVDLQTWEACEIETVIDYLAELKQ